jgi:hypothetical protein
MPVTLISLVPAHAAATTRYVATTGSDLDNDCSDSLNPCASIDTAIVQANAGDTISVGAGTFAESDLVRISLTISGAGSDQTMVTGDGSGPSITVDGTDTATVPDVTLSDLAVSGNASDAGLDVVLASATLSNGAASFNSGDGIAIAEGTLDVSHSVIDSNNQTGVEVDPGSATVTSIRLKPTLSAGSLPRRRVPPRSTEARSTATLAPVWWPTTPARLW